MQAHVTEEQSKAIATEMLSTMMSNAQVPMEERGREYPAEAVLNWLSDDALGWLDRTKFDPNLRP